MITLNQLLKRKKKKCRQKYKMLTAALKKRLNKKKISFISLISNKKIKINKKLKV